MYIHIVAGGPEDHLPAFEDYKDGHIVWVGVDRGVFYLLERNIKPDVAFGDFDSVAAGELKLIESKVSTINRFQPEKDETDMELALNWAIKQNPDEIRIFGATGGRLDHFFANVHLLVPPVKDLVSVPITIIDRHNHLYVKGPGNYKIDKISDKKYISFVPVTMNISDLTLEGFKYPLRNRHISVGSTLCISNELICDYGTFSFSEGILLVVRSHD